MATDAPRDPWVGIPVTDAERIRTLACAQDPVRVRPLEGGITNRNYRLDLRGGSVVVRVSDPESSLLAIDREAERVNSMAAAVSGAAPAVVEHGAGLLVVGWVEGPPLDAAGIGDASNWPRIAEACRLLHAGPVFAGRFDMFEVQARYLDVVRERGFRLPAGYVDHLPALSRLRAAMAEFPETLVPCNNDLLPANFVDDGNRLWIIDYEYSGMNEASFEIGNIWSEASLPPDDLDGIVAAYWGREDPVKVARARAWALAAKLGWMLWASIQDAVSPIDFDYWSWGLEKYDRAVAELRDGILDRLVPDL